MSDQSTNRDDKLPYGAVKEFVSYYHEEMHRNIDRLREVALSLKRAEEPENLLCKVEEIGQAMSDLAMVYGFESEEVIGRKIILSVNDFRSGRDLNILIATLEEAARAAEEAMFLADERKEREILSQLVEPQPEEDTSVREEVSQTAEIEEELLFDIREDEKLISLLSDVDGQAIEIEGQEAGINDPDEIEILDIHSILPDEVKKRDFDIPEKKEDILSQLEEDVLEIDFRKPPVQDKKEKAGLFKRISSFLGFKGKNRLSLQE